MKNDIMVSICCMTYNQEEYIKDALEGFVNQQTNFKYEVIIHDDASTDNTQKIIKEYHKKYPNIIKPIFQKENQYSQGQPIMINVFKKAKGKYIALCEGDDYWIDSKKLQMQVDYLEKNNDCTFIFHNAKVIDILSGKTENLIPQNSNAKKVIQSGNDYDVEQMELINFIPTASVMFRNRDAKRIPDWFNKCYVGDWPLRLIMTSFGYAHYIDEVMSVYRFNAKGSVTVKNNKKEKTSIEGKRNICEKREFIIKNIDEFTDYKYHYIFELRAKENEINFLIDTGRKNEIIKNGYLKDFPFIKKIKLIVQIYFTDFYEVLRKIKKRLGVRQCNQKK